MPPKEDGTSRAFTFITGNPRSRSNITQIRRHAGQNSGHRTTLLLAPTTPVSSDGVSLPARSQTWSPKQDAPETFRPLSAAEITDPSTPFPALSQVSDSWSLQGSASGLIALHVEAQGSSNALDHSVITASPSTAFAHSPRPLASDRTNSLPALDARADDTTTQALPVYRSDHLPRDGCSHSSVHSAPLRMDPSAPSSFSVSHDQQPRKLSIRELMNHSDAEEPNSDAEDGPGTHGTSDLKFRANDGRTARTSSPSQLLPANRGLVPARKPPKRRKNEHHVILKVNISKRRTTVPGSTSRYAPGLASRTSSTAKRSMSDPALKQSTVSVAARPSVIAGSLPPSKDDALIEHTLSQAAAFFDSQFSGARAQEQRYPRITAYLVDDAARPGLIEIFSGAIATAAGLLAIDRIDTASRLLQHILPCLPELLSPPSSALEEHQHHTQLYPVLAELALDTQADNSLARLRSQVRHFTANLAHTLLGAWHPLTNLLRVEPGSPAQANRLRELLQRQMHTLHQRTFGVSDSRTTAQAFHLARVLVQLRQAEAAVAILDDVTQTCEQQHGRASLPSVVGTIEGAKARMMQQPTDSSVFSHVEAMLLDALQRTMALVDPRRGLSLPRPADHTIVHARMACLRALGRLCMTHGRVGAATHWYAAGVQAGLEALGAGSAAVQLLLADAQIMDQIVALRDC